MKADGQGKLRLKLDLPLAELAKTRVSGEYDFAANDATVLPWLPPVEAAAGRVAFTESSFTLHDARARFRRPDRPFGRHAHGRLIEVIARGDASVDATRALFDHPLRKHVSGSFGYFLTVRAQDGLARITFESPLRGVESARRRRLPKRWRLDAAARRIESEPVERDRVSVSLGNLARVEVQRRRQGAAMAVQRTAVWLSPGDERRDRLPERPGTLVYGSLNEFDLDRWLPLFFKRRRSAGRHRARAAAPSARRPRPASHRGITAACAEAPAGARTSTPKSSPAMSPIARPRSRA